MALGSVLLGLGAAQAMPPGTAGFEDGTVAAGIEFHHVSGAFGEMWMPEVNGAGVAFFDADGDGHVDVLFAQGMPWPGHEDAVPAARRDATLRLYRNDGAGAFHDVTAASGLAVTMYGFAPVPGDYDGDGDADLYVTAYGPNRLFRNDGHGTFTDVTEAAGVGDSGWGSSAAWLDHDRDGDLDLFVGNYLEWTPAGNRRCSLDGRSRSYCNPRAYPGQSSVLYRNEGDGTFRDVSLRAGIRGAGGKALGVALLDADDDGWIDVAVAADTEPDLLFRNEGDGTFEEVGVLSGMALDAAGGARAGMGIDVGDVHNDGRQSIAVGNFSSEMIGLYEPGEGGVYTDVAPGSRLGRTSLDALTFALFFFDQDLDGWMDLLAVNGHVFPDVQVAEPWVSYAQRPLLYRNDGAGGFVEAGEELGGPLLEARVGRGAAHADVDGDGDLDVAVTTLDGPAALWINRTRDGADPPHVLRVRLVGTRSNRDAIGASVTVRAGAWQQRQMVRSGSSYLSQSELTLTFGLGRGREPGEVRIAWPAGGTTRLPGPELAGAVDHELTVVEGRGVTGRRPLRRGS